ncbi:MAG TPA: HNH endonuclease signature motif containing protein [Streptosporangiaceae bacterium]|nr:HNH endonuclease signature motif containing protein [Streptosporangiaceae bacterium]
MPDDDGPPAFPDWLEADWIEHELDLDREEPSDAELNGLWHDPLAGAPEDARDLGGSAAQGPAEALGAGFTRDLPSDPPSGFAAGGPLDSLVPGPVLAGFTADAFECGLPRLSDDELVGVLLAARRLSSWQEALELSAVSELDARRRHQAARPASSRAGEHVSEELAVALVLTGRAADRLLGLSRELDRLPMVLKSLREGRIDQPRAVVFAEELILLTQAQARAIVMALIRPAEKMTTSQLRAAIRALILATIPGTKEERDRKRAERARRDARVEVWPEASGNAAIAGRELPASEVIAADQRLTAIARRLRDAGVPGSLEELRAMAYTALLTGRDLDALLPDADAGASAGSEGPDGPPASRLRPAPGELASLSGSVNLTMPLSAWLGTTDAPGDAEAYGPLAADDCRDLAKGLAAAGKRVQWCITLTGPDGRAVAHGCARASPGIKPGSIQAWLAKVKLSRIECGICTHERQTRAYRPPDLMRHLVCIRQRTCAFPGCRRPARRCDLDHTTPFDQGGRTCPCNLEPACRQHHRTKQAPGWHLHQPQPGTLIWTAPHGRTYIREPDPYPT